MRKLVKIFLVVGIFVGILGLGFFVNEKFGVKFEKFSENDGKYRGEKRINWQKYPKFQVNLEENLNITKSGTYEISGEIQDGMIFVDVGDEDGKVKIILNGVFVENKNGPALYIKSADEVFVEIGAGTKNTLVDGKKYDEKSFQNADGTIFSKGNLYFYGNGDLSVQGNYRNGIVGKDDVEIWGGNFDISAKNNGISTNDNFQIFGGTINVRNSYEGFEAGNILINDGIIDIKSVNDGINAGDFIKIQGGKIAIDSNDDGIDSNGDIAIFGGNINIKLSDNPKCEALDSVRGIIYEGGEVFVNGAKLDYFTFFK